MVKEIPYNPYTRARGDQQFSKVCLNCGAELTYFRYDKHQHWRWCGRDLDAIVEIDGVVYLKCCCGNRVRTNLKPMTANMPCDMAVKWGYVSSLERCRKIHQKYKKKR